MKLLLGMIVGFVMGVLSTMVVFNITIESLIEIIGGMRWMK